MTLRRALRRLRLKEGDILIVRDENVHRHLRDHGHKMGLKFSVPLVFAPGKNDIRVKR